MDSRPDDLAVHSGRADSPRLTLVRQSHTRGFLFGFAQRCLLASVRIRADGDILGLVDRLASAIAPYALPGSDLAEPRLPSSTTRPAIMLMEQLVRSTAALQDAAGIPVRRGWALLHDHDDTDGDGTLELQIAMPSLQPHTAGDTLKQVIALAELLWNESLTDDEPRALLDQLMGQLRDAAPKGNNVRHLIRAGLDLGIPQRWLPERILQLGWGERARLIRESETDATPRLSAVLASNKIATAVMLRAAEIPVPENAIARGPDAAAEVARRIGFPVVVKPADQARGAGVTAGVTSEAEVRRAYALALSSSPNVMVEKHLDGKEYRLVVVQQRLFWAYERVPAHVIGDGISTVGELVDESNRMRRDGPSTGLALVTISVDDSVLEILDQQGLTLDSVPASSRIVRLQHIPSNAGGGEVRSVFDSIHPDNIAIAERAARLLRIDIAGIDFISPDIARSWREVGGCITEINHQPQISPLSRPDIHHALLQQLIDGDGRVPTAIVLGDRKGTVQATVRTLLAQSGLCAGIASPRDISIGAEEIAKGTIDPFRGAAALVTDPTVRMIVMFTDGHAILRHGLPFEKVDVLVIADDRPGCCNIDQFLSAVKPHLRAEALTARGDPAAAAIARVIGGRSLRLVKSPADLAAALCKLLLAHHKQ